MHKSLTSFTCLFALAGCLQADIRRSGADVPVIDSANFISHRTPFFYEHENDESFDVDSSLRTRLNWADGLAAQYIRRSDDPSILQAVSDSSIAWLWDRLLHTDTADYIVLQLGHDEHSGDKRIFATDRWLYVDTLSRKVYEYDIPNDSLIGLNINE
jgi:hypothetical protein